MTISLVILFEMLAYLIADVILEGILRGMTRIALDIKRAIGWRPNN